MINQNKVLNEYIKQLRLIETQKAPIIYSVFMVTVIR